MTWRDHCRPIIAEVITRVGTADRKALRKALREAYPYGDRDYHPYKIWCDEIRVQLGEKPGKQLPPPHETPLFDERRCRVCGCTDLDCRGCIQRTGEPCWWIEEDLCSACAAKGTGRP